MAFANTKVHLTSDEWNKFQLINAAICSGLTAKVELVNKTDIFSNPIGKPKVEQVNLFMPGHGGFSLNAAAVPNNLVISLFNNILKCHNSICSNEADFCVSTLSGITPSPLITLQYVNPLGELQPVDLFKLSCQQLKRDKKAEAHLATFIDHACVNYDTCIKGLEMLSWGKNISAALAENKKLVEQEKELLIGSSGANAKQ